MCDKETKHEVISARNCANDLPIFVAGSLRRNCKICVIIIAIREYQRKFIMYYNDYVSFAKGSGDANALQYYVIRTYITRLITGILPYHS
jgi:hypothetical protein